jgi:hypothetical protein
VGEPDDDLEVLHRWTDQRRSRQGMKCAGEGCCMLGKTIEQTPVDSARAVERVGNAVA